MNLNTKYRPKKLSQIVGHQTSTGILRGMLQSQKIPPTLLISGPRGLGKTTIGRIIGRAVNCCNPDKGDPCLDCESCKLEKHPDIIEINAADNRGIDDIRHIIDTCRLAPRYKRRIYILDEAHQYTIQAFNSALLLFEEPPKSVTFILLTTDPEKIPTTILSRCQKIKLNPLSNKILSDHLQKIGGKEKFKLKEKHALKISEVSDGHPRDALNLLEMAISYYNSTGKEIKIEKAVNEVVKNSPQGILMKFVDAVLNEDPKTAIGIAKGVDSHESFLLSVMKTFRTLLHYSIDPNLVENGYFRSQMKNLREVDPIVAGMILKTFSEAYTQAKSYILPVEVILDIAIAKTSVSKK